MPLPSKKFNTRDLNLHYFLTNWAENSLYARFYSVKTACLRYLAARRKRIDPCIVEMIYLEVIAKMIMQSEDLAHLCLFILTPHRRPNAFYFSTNAEIADFFNHEKFTSLESAKTYMGISTSMELLTDREEKRGLEDVLREDVNKCQQILKDSITFWKEYNLIAKHYLHGIPNFRLQEARDITPIDSNIIEAEKLVKSRPQDFMTLVMANDSGARTFHNIEHTASSVKQLKRISGHIHAVTKAIAFTELSKLDISMGGLPHLYFVANEDKSEENIALLKRHFIMPWLD